MHDSIIIGAGISGLGVAARLVMQGYDPLVLEKAAGVGGTMTSRHEQGYLIDFGPTTILHTTPLIDDLIRFAGLEADRCPANETSSNRFVVRDGVMQPLPLGPGAFLASSLFSWRAKLRLLREPFIARGPVGESIGAFTRRRLGPEFLDYAIDPFVSGIYAGDPSRLSVQWAFPRLEALERDYGSLIKGTIKGARARRRLRESSGEQRRDKASIFSFVQGVGSLPAAIAARLGAQRVVVGCDVRGLARRQDGFEVTYHGPAGPTRARSRSLVLAVPAYALDPYMQMCNPAYSGGLADLEYAPVVQLFLGFRRQQVGHPLHGFGVLIPHREQRRILGSLWTSSLFPGRAPAGHVALTCFLGGMRHPEMVDMDEEQLLAISLEELGSLLTIDGPPVFWTLKRWPRAIPQYNLGYERYVSRMQGFEADTPGVFLCGNFRGGIAVGDCVKQAAQVAEQLATTLGAPRTP